MKTALITGVSGQDGSYLAEHLLAQGYRVCGLVRRGPDSVRWLRPIQDKIEFMYGDMRDALSLETAFRKADPDEVYNLAAQVFVPASWHDAAQTFDVNVGGLARLLYIIERLKPSTRIYQASSSEMYGNVGGPANETTPFKPVSPYGVSKLAAHELCRVYREKGIFAASGILFNHESPRRGPEMVTRKISLAAARWAHGDQTILKLGNVCARRDWGFAGDYTKAMWLMLQQETPKDFVIGTGESHRVLEFVVTAIRQIGEPSGAMFSDGDKDAVRPNEIHDLVADPRLAAEELGWSPSVRFPELVQMMVEADCKALEAQC